MTKLINLILVILCRLTTVCSDDNNETESRKGHINLYCLLTESRRYSGEYPKGSELTIY